MAASILGAAENVNVLDDAILDYSGTSPTSFSSGHSQTSRSQTTSVLDESYYDWTPQDLQRLEEAEFAAFEVPEDLKVQD
jgi:hypothetical protein